MLQRRFKRTFLLNSDIGVLYHQAQHLNEPPLGLDIEKSKYESQNESYESVDDGAPVILAHRNLKNAFLHNRADAELLSEERYYNPQQTRGPDVKP